MYCINGNICNEFLLREKKIISIGESVCIVICWYLYKIFVILFVFLIDF